MIKNKILFGLMFGIVFGMILMGGVSAMTYTCYQETPNVTTGCGFDTGKYSVADINVIDGNWNTGGGMDSNWYINYTVNPKATGSLWQLKTSPIFCNSYSITTENISLAACLAIDQKQIRFNVSQETLPCLEENTLINTPEGNKKITDLKIGDIVLSYNEKSKNIENDIVKNITIHNISKNFNKFYIIKTNNNEIKVTWNHPIYVYNAEKLEIKDAENIKIGDYLLNDNAKKDKIISIEIISSYGELYSLDIKNNHNYFANGILNHNKVGEPWMYYTYYYCNGVDIKHLKTGDDGAACGGTWYPATLFEESIIWNITSPNVTLYYPSGLFSYVTPGLNTSLNYSVIPDISANLSSCWYYYNTTNRTLNCTINSTITLYAQKNLTFSANDTSGGLYSWIKNWDYNIFEHTRSYANLTTAGSLETFTINITYPTTIYSGITATLVYNNTNYIMTTADTGGTQKYSISIPIAWTDTTFNNTFYYSFFLVNSTGNVTQNSSTYNQTVTTFLIDNCSTYTKKIMTFSMKDEETLGILNGTVKITAYFYDADRIYLFNTFNATLRVNSSNVNTSSVCLANITGSYSMDYVAQFYNGSQGMALGTTAGGYWIKYKMIQNYTLNNLTTNQNVTLYDLLYASGYVFQIIVRGISGNIGLLVDTQKQYLSTADFKSVESYVTDASGTAVSHLVQAAAVYNFIISKNGHLLGTFNNYQVKCDNYATGECIVRLNVNQATSTLQDFTKFGNIQGVFLVDQATRTLFYTWTSSDGAVHTVAQQIILFDGYANTTICNQSASGTSGTFTCVIPDLYGNTTFFARTSVDGNFVNSFVFAIGSSPDFKGADVIIELLMFSSLVLLFLQAPVFIVIGAILGMIMAIMLLFMGGASTWVILSIIGYFTAAGVLIISHLRRGI